MKDYASSFKKNFIRSVSQGYLHLTIMPTEQCNFRCVYCYEDFEIGKMSADTVIGIKNLLSKAAPSLKQLKIDWFGGEPTLNKKAIVEISEHIIALQKHFEFSYKAHMTTNGFLLDLSMFTRFVALGIDDYQITLDGEKDVHDTTRLQMNGKGSFDVIWNNLKDYKQYSGQFDVAMRLHVSANNAESMWNLCQRIKAEFGHDKRFHINVEEIKNLGKGVETADPAAYVATDAKARVAELVAMMSTDITEKI